MLHANLDWLFHGLRLFNDCGVIVRFQGSTQSPPGRLKLGESGRSYSIPASPKLVFHKGASVSSGEINIFFL